MIKFEIQGAELKHFMFFDGNEDELYPFINTRFKFGMLTSKYSKNIELFASSDERNWYIASQIKMNERLFTRKQIKELERMVKHDSEQTSTLGIGTDAVPSLGCKNQNVKTKNSTVVFGF